MVSLLETSEDFQKIIAAKELSVVLFSADFAEQCKQVKDVMEELGKLPELSAVNLRVINAEDLSEISMKHQIEAVPSVLFFSSGKAIDRVDGANVADITTKIKRHASALNVGNDAGSINDRLKALINRHNVMLFMKGDRDTPRCGFSKQIIAILNETGVAYDTFDILTDEVVRQELKTYSEWPTYPQLYVKGELIGGLDIVKELVSSGEFVDTLKG